MPRLGLGMPLTAGLSQEAVTIIDDFFFESDTSGEVTPFPTADRTNRLAYSEDLSQTGVYGRANVDVASNNTTAPDGTLTAETVTPTTTNGIHTLSMTGTNTVAMSVFAKANGYNMFRFNTGSSSNGRATFDLSDGTIHATSGTFFSKASIEDHGNGWYRCSCVIVGGSATNMTIAIENSSGSVSFAADGTSGIHFWGAQSEDNTETTAYIPTASSTVTVTPALNDTSNVWDFDSTDIMLEADPEDEGFWEEGSNIVLNGDYEELGSELVTNGDFSTAGTLTSSSYSLGWSSPDSGISISSGVLNLTRVSSGGRAYASNGSNGGLAITSGKTYQLTYTITENTDNSTLQYHNGGAYVSTSSSVPGTYTVTYVAAGTIFLFRNNSIDTTIKLDNVSLKQVDPNNRWTLGTNWSISDGKAVGTATTTNLQQLSILEVGNTYELTFTISDYSSGSVKPNVGGVDGTTRSSNGTFTEIIGPATTTHFYFDGVSAFTGKIDNVTIREYAIQPQDV